MKQRDTFSNNLSLSFRMSICSIIVGTIVYFTMDAVQIKNLDLLVTGILLILTNSYLLSDFELNSSKKKELMKTNFLISAIYIILKFSYNLSVPIAKITSVYFLNSGMTFIVFCPLLYLGVTFIFISLIVFRITKFLSLVVVDFQEKHGYYTTKDN